MTEKNDGGPAYPYPACTAEGYPGQNAHDGMSLRVYLAAQALAGLIGHRIQGLGWELKGDLAYGRGEWKTSPQMLAAAAFRIADAMLAEGDRP